MCTRYTIASSSEAIETEYQAEFQYSYSKCFNAHPGLTLPVICNDDEKKIHGLRWGLVPPWSKDPEGDYRHINAHTNKVVKHPVFRAPIRKRRCLILSNCFFVWVADENGHRIPHVVYDSRQRILSFAGIWEKWINREDKSVHYSFAIITCPPNARLAKFCSKMPVIIPQGRRRKYLRPSCYMNEVMSMLKPWESDTMNLFPVSTEVNNTANSTRQVLNPTGQRIYKEYEYVQKVYLKLEGMGSRKDNPDRKPEIKLML